MVIGFGSGIRRAEYPPLLAYCDSICTDIELEGLMHNSYTHTVNLVIKAR
jgi:hypothetical protein